MPTPRPSRGPTEARARPGRFRVRGAAAVELALVLILLLPLVMGLLEYGWMFLKSQEIASAARDGARIAATESGTNALVQAYVTQAMANAGLSSSGYSVALTPGNVASAAPGTPVQVTVTVPYANISLTNLTSLIPTPTDLAGSTSMVKEGP